MSRLRNGEDADGVKVNFTDEDRRLAGGAEKDAHQHNHAPEAGASLGGQDDEDPAMTGGFGAVLNKIYNSQSGPDPSSAHNKNPGGPANTIREAGPSSPLAEDYTHGHDTVSAPAIEADIPGRMHDADACMEERMDTGRAQTRFGSHWATTLLERLDNPRSVIALVLIVVILAAMVGLMNLSRDTPQPISAAVPAQPATPVPVDTVPVLAELEEIRAVQMQVTRRQNELEAAVTNLRESSDRQWAANAALLHKIQNDQHKALSEVSKTIDSLREQLRKSQLTARPPGTAQRQAGPGQTGDQAPGNRQDLVVNLASFTREQPVRDMMARLQGLGITTEQQVVTLNGKTLYRLRAAGFSSAADAKEFVIKLRTEHGIKDAWVGPRQDKPRRDHKVQ